MDKSEVDQLEKQINDLIGSDQYLFAYRHISSLLKALKNDNKNWKNSDQITKYKKLLVEVNKKWLETFQTASVSVDISNQEVEDFIAPFLNAQSLEELFYMFMKNFLKRKEDTDKLPVSIAQRYCSVMTVDDRWNIIQGSTDNELHSSAQNFHLWIKTWASLLQIVFDVLCEEKWLNTKNICEYMYARWLFHDQDAFEKTFWWIEYFLVWEHIASMSILVPNFEDILINLVWRLWWDSIKINHSLKGMDEISTEDRTLSDTMFEVLGKLLSEEVVYQIKFIMTDKLWLCLRHRVSHWKLDMQEFNKQNNFIVILMYLLLCSQINKVD